MNIELELHNLKRKVLNGKHISDQFKKEIANKIFQIEKEVAINYTHCCTELKWEGCKKLVKLVAWIITKTI